MSTYYELLGVPKDADEEQIGLRYRELALKYHPDKTQDKGVAKEIFLKLAKAYEVLMYPEKRRIYDAGGDPSVEPEEYSIDYYYPEKLSKEKDFVSKLVNSDFHYDYKIKKLRQWGENCLCTAVLLFEAYEMSEAEKLNSRNNREKIVNCATDPAAEAEEAFSAVSELEDSKRAETDWAKARYLYFVFTSADKEEKYWSIINKYEYERFREYITESVIEESKKNGTFIRNTSYLKELFRMAQIFRYSEDSLLSYTVYLKFMSTVETKLAENPESVEKEKDLILSALKFMSYTCDDKYAVIKERAKKLIEKVKSEPLPESEATK